MAFEYERSELDRRWVLGNSATTGATTCKQKVDDIPTSLLFLDPTSPPPAAYVVESVSVHVSMPRFCHNGS